MAPQLPKQRFPPAAKTRTQQEEQLRRIIASHFRYLTYRIKQNRDLSSPVQGLSCNKRHMETYLSERLQPEVLELSPRLSEECSDWDYF